MEDSAPVQDDTSDPSSGQSFPVVFISDDGDIVLDVTFETSRETIAAARKTWQAASKKIGAPRIPQPNLSPSIRVAYRVKLSVLKRHSRYFENLLGNKQFSEASNVEETLARLATEKLKLAEVDPRDLPWITIVDDDEATRSIGREKVFEDLMRIMHGKQIQSTTVNMLHVTTLAILADRFDCRSLVSRYLSIELKFKWPLTSAKAARAGTQKKTLDVENLLRQKILVAWLLEQPPRLHNYTRELILRGSVRWSALSLDEFSRTELWWHLPDGLERELQYRRECVLNTIASVHRHFIALYSSRDRQCKLGYDSSSACDSFQLGQMLKFFTSKELIGIVDFGPSSYDNIPDSSVIDIEEILAMLKQVPGYQIDKNHTNCGIRTRLEPIVEYIRSMLSSTVLSISQVDWKNNRVSASWVPDDDEVASLDNEEKKFEFTRGLASDQRLRYEGNMYADKMARKLFTADKWDWTPEY
ncbi:hydroxyproline-rich glycoprotein [Colletotrichum tofieldiae]|uniref:Hydroxyproline-rich glycoprotein n=1 Tax=Colletotrichum tofieldiae TaxID=708197 RepID=A0A166RA99_9PEZI|nr:hydroxyproline-rich glycoprotein [Colletotrichum tofieldiae]GKT57196.1 hydroxyproline-rich glycoprotein [Colletotrichum tofieldiae]GKT78927.1 hydroxyproline-rich glycoprotein [Colletotrichum tofieldiae]GKT86746.1 hydroxyproline-rich glycoprotein [Colletotrichum tofieldiae]